MNYTGPFAVPSFDQFVTTHLIIKAAIRNNTDPNFLRRIMRMTQGRLDNLILLGRLSFAPDTPAVRSLVQGLNHTSRLFRSVFDKIYNTEAEAVDQGRTHAHAARTLSSMSPFYVFLIVIIIVTGVLFSFDDSQLFRSNLVFFDSLLCGV